MEQDDTAEQLDAVDLTYLSDRSRAYVIGLEARLRELREENTQLRTKLNDPSLRDEKALRQAYKRGREEGLEEIASGASAALSALHRLRDVAVAGTMSPGWRESVLALHAPNRSECGDATCPICESTYPCSTAQALHVDQWDESTWPADWDGESW